MSKAIWLCVAMKPVYRVWLGPALEVSASEFQVLSHEQGSSCSNNLLLT